MTASEEKCNLLPLAKLCCKTCDFGLRSHTLWGPFLLACFFSWWNHLPCCSCSVEKLARPEIISTSRKTRSSIPKFICLNNMQVGSELYPSHNKETLSLTHTLTTACEWHWGRGLYEPWPTETLGQWIVMVKAHSFEEVCYMIVDNGYQDIAGLNTCFNYGNLLFVCVPPHVQWYMCGDSQEDSFLGVSSLSFYHVDPGCEWNSSCRLWSSDPCPLSHLNGPAFPPSPLCSILGMWVLTSHESHCWGCPFLELGLIGISSLYCVWCLLST